MFVLELRVLPVLRRSLEGSGAPMDFADEERSENILNESKTHFHLVAARCLILSCKVRMRCSLYWIDRQQKNHHPCKQCLKFEIEFF